MDGFFSFFSGVGSYGVIWIILGIFLVIWEEIKNKRELLALVFTVIFSLTFSEFFLKNIFRRFRPEYTIGGYIHNIGTADSYSFPSSHSVIAFACAYILSKSHKKFRFAFFLLACIIAFSRIYLGKHYPLDVLAGATVGIVIGMMVDITNKNLKKKHE